MEVLKSHLSFCNVAALHVLWRRISFWGMSFRNWLHGYTLHEPGAETRCYVTDRDVILRAGKTWRLLNRILRCEVCVCVGRGYLAHLETCWPAGIAARAELACCLQHEVHGDKCRWAVPPPPLFRSVDFLSWPSSRRLWGLWSLIPASRRGQDLRVLPGRR